MNEKLHIITERVDDIPVLLAQMERLGLAALLDAHFPVHGNWPGLDFSLMTTLWLSSILSRGDHRLVPIEPWGAQRPCTLKVELSAEGYERQERMAFAAGGACQSGTERRLMVRSVRHAKAAEAGLRARVAQAKAQVGGRNQRGRGTGPPTFGRGGRVASNGP